MPFLNRNVTRLVLTTAALLLAGALSTEAATIRVCDTGCDYTPAQLQTALNAAAPGDVVLLQTNKLFTGAFVLPPKSCAAQNDTCYITLKTGVTSTGVIMGAGSFPAANVRITPDHSGVLARLQASGNNVVPLRTVTPGETGSGCAVAPCVSSYWRIQLLEFVSQSYGGNVFLALGNNDVSAGVSGGNTQDVIAEEPHHLIVDQVLFNGDPVSGQERAMLIAARNVILRNSYCQNVMAVGDKAGIWIDNSSGSIDIVNNYIGCGTENIIYGGDVPRMNHDTTVAASPAPTTTSFALAAAPKDFLLVGNGLSVVVAGVKRYTHVTAINGSTLTVEALPAAPSAGAAVNYSVVPRGGTVTKNHLYKPPAWRNPFVSTPQSVTASGATTGGALATGTYYYKVVAWMNVNAGQTGRSTASVEVSATVESGTTGKVTVSWAAVPNADWYFVYRGSSGGQNIRQYTTDVSFVDTGLTSGTACPLQSVDPDYATVCLQSVPTSTGTTWMMKNLFEIKKYAELTVEGNLMEYSWQSGQTGYAVLFTPANNSTGVDGNDSSVIRDIIFRYNRIRHSAAVMQIVGLSADGDISDRTTGLTISHNIFEDVGTAWGIKENGILITTGSHTGYQLPRGPANIVIDHNTIINAQGKSVILFDLYKNDTQYEAVNFDVSNNLLRKVDYGLRSNSPGLLAEGVTSWDAGTDATSAFLNNVVVGASCSVYPATTICPNEATFQSAFSNYAGGNFTVTSQWTTAATDGTAIGAHPSLIDPLTTIALTGDNSGGVVLTPPTITTADVPAATRGAAYTTTFTATGGTTPYTWTVSGGTLPAGLTLSTGGVLSGTPTAPGASLFTIQVTGADTAASERSYALTVVDVLTPASRPGRFNWSEIGIFGRDTCPTDAASEVRKGDLCYELTTDNLFKATSTAPTVIWEPVAGTATPQIPVTIMFLGSPSSVTTWSDMPAALTEWRGSVRTGRTMADTTNATEFRIMAFVQVAGAAGATLRVEYATDSVPAWEYLDGAAGTGGAVAVDVVGNPAGAWTSLTANAKGGTKHLRVIGIGGDGAVDPSFGPIIIQIR